MMSTIAAIRSIMNSIDEALVLCAEGEDKSWTFELYKKFKGFDPKKIETFFYWKNLKKLCKRYKVYPILKT